MEKTKVWFFIFGSVFESGQGIKLKKNSNEMHNKYYIDDVRNFIKCLCQHNGHVNSINCLNRNQQ